jgi:hypothetical protein
MDICTACSVCVTFIPKSDLVVRPESRLLYYITSKDIHVAEYSFKLFLQFQIAVPPDDAPALGHCRPNLCYCRRTARLLISGLPLPCTPESQSRSSQRRRMDAAAVARLWAASRECWVSKLTSQSSSAGNQPSCPRCSRAAVG